MPTITIEFDAVLYERMEQVYLLHALPRPPRVGDLSPRPLFGPRSATDAEAAASLMAVLEDCTPHEVLAVQGALRIGRLEGMSTTSCLLGIVARCRGLGYEDLLMRWGPTAIEDWLIAHVHHGMTPASSVHAALLDSWLSEWLEAHTLETESAPVRPVYRQRAATFGGDEGTP